MHVKELTERERVQGLIAGHFIIKDDQVVPTNYGAACVLVDKVCKRMASLLDEQKPPCQEDIQFMLVTSLQARMYLSNHERRYGQKEQVGISE